MVIDCEGWSNVSVATTLLVGILVMAGLRAKRKGALADYKSPFQAQGKRIFASLFWQIDIIGILLIIVAAGLFLVPFTLARSNLASWSQPHIIAPVVIGILTFPTLFYWERKCKYPLIPFHVSYNTNLQVAPRTDSAATQRPRCLGGILCCHDAQC